MVTETSYESYLSNHAIPFIISSYHFFKFSKKQNKTQVSLVFVFCLFFRNLLCLYFVAKHLGMTFALLDNLLHNMH